MSLTKTLHEHIPMQGKNCHVFVLFVMGILSLALAGCSTWQAPARFDDSVLRDRAETAQLRDVRLSAAVLSSSDSQKMFGVNVNRKEVQPVWIEVENNTSQPLWLLRSGTDPDLFSPLEVAWSFHSKFGGERNDRIDEHFDSLGFQNPISPGTKQSGIIFTNPHRFTRLLSIDILGNGEIFPFVLFPPVPDDHTAQTAAVYNNLNKQLAAITVNIQDIDSLRATLEQLPCCALNEDGTESDDPVNIIMVGSLEDISSAVVRRGYRLDIQNPDKIQMLYDRPPDIVLRKIARVREPSKWMRAWMAPFSYQDKPVFLAQVGRRRGGHTEAILEADAVLNNRSDEARNLFVQDMVYSSGLKKIAFISSAATTEAGVASGRLPGDGIQRADGLRAVLFVVSRPLSMSDLEFLDWNHYLQKSVIDAMEKTENVEN